MAGPLPVGAMPRHVPEVLHQHPQAPQPRAPMPQHNGAPAGFPAFIPINTQSYHPPPAPPVHAVPTDLRRPDPVEISDLRGRDPQTYRALRLEKAPTTSSVDGKARETESAWEQVIRTEKTISQSMIRDRIEHLQKNTKSVAKKKQEKNETIQLQLDKAQADLTSWDHDVRFYYKLVQLESEWRAADDRKHKDERTERSAKKHRGHSKRSKSPKMERVAVIAYFKRTPTVRQHDPGPIDVDAKMRYMQQVQQPSVQPNMKNLPPVILSQGFSHPATAGPFRSTTSTMDPRLNFQPKPILRQQAVHPVPQAQSPHQGTFRNPQQSGMAPARQDNAMTHAAGAARPGQGGLPAQQPTRLPAVRLPIHPPHIKGPLPASRTSPTTAPAGPGTPAGAFETGNLPQGKIVVETDPNTRDNIKVYHVSDRSSSSSDDFWSDDESEGTRPSSINSDNSLPHRGRGRSPKRTHPDHLGNVIIQDPRHVKKDAEYVSDERAPKHSRRPHVRFDSPDHRYREGSRSPRREPYSQRRSEESRMRAEPPRIIQQVRHVPAPRREVFSERFDRDNQPLERARMRDTHREHEGRRDSVRFKHAEEDVRPRHEFRERRHDRREEDRENAESDSRWSDEEARDYMRQREQPNRPSLRPSRHQEGRDTHKVYINGWE
ncbi:hypothetical protein FSARC_13238 [Fusarium sarcochroum]|uniref:Uncharacterized protein n=1 Tax=Fusarium sarcochroum TaxID=1208366 RepID=A0A8H4T2X8_9HYPO|nr:hypothetical protein FSARC_13238 [Fusarium sarcochroum]